ncbi:uncharacterized protein RCC_08699 [Ramularia collo-cygni]|uniref:Uncharacterized protein n=1 Tax=Ramularia collo-cygni TaxID=112498 RepID=A0A2D3VFS3_9PEZI|nr:uncharacterized protein RCC_08699 [Ramularia collo-cygni]CZT22991.1 uncharacterized protein RCC_08699 [Ramularia collo-cygni]
MPRKKSSTTISRTVPKPYIVETSTTRLNITKDGLLGILYKANIAESILRAAGVTNLPAPNLCPAFKMIACVKMLEQHGLQVPKEIITPIPATSLRHLPRELLDQIVDLALGESKGRRRRKNATGYREALST